MRWNVSSSHYREKLPDDEEFAIAGDLSELEARPAEQTNGKTEANGTTEQKGNYYQVTY